MTKQDLSHRIADTTGVRADVVETILNEAISEIKQAVNRGEAVTLRTFGTFSRHVQPAKTARNISRGYAISLPPCYAPKIKFAKTWRQELIALTKKQAN